MKMREKELQFNPSPEEESGDFSLERNIMTKEEIEKRTEALREKIKDSPDLKFTEAFYKEFEKNKPEAKFYLVGGAVRDGLLEREIEDYDFVATGLTKEELYKFLSKHGKVKEVESRAFGVFKFVPKGSELTLDVALPRTDEWVGKGYKDVQVETSPKLGVEKDLSRRDFTINAITLDLKSYEIVDPYNGVRDLEKGIIKAVGKPEERFNEDPSRILRAIRFSRQLDFKIEANTSRAMEKKVKEINKLYLDEEGDYKPRVAREVLAKEFLKSFDADPVKTLELYDEYGILDLKVEKNREEDKIMPEVKAMQGVEQPKNFHSEGDVWQHIKLALESLPSNASIDLKLATLFHDVGKPPTITYPETPEDRIRFNEHDVKGEKIAKKICNRLRFSAPEEICVDVDKVAWLVKNHMICLSDKVENMRDRTIEKYFFREDLWGDELLEISKADISATIPFSGKPDFSNYDLLCKRIEKLRIKLASPEAQRKLVPDILDGGNIIEIANIQPSPLVGDIKSALRELQLGGKIKERGEAEKLAPKLKEIFEKKVIKEIKDREERINKALKVFAKAKK